MLKYNYHVITKKKEIKTKDAISKYAIWFKIIYSFTQLASETMPYNRHGSQTLNINYCCCWTFNANVLPSSEQGNTTKQFAYCDEFTEYRGPTNVGISLEN